MHAASTICDARVARGLHWGARWGKGTFTGVKDKFYSIWTVSVSWESLSTMARWAPRSLLLSQAARACPQESVFQRWGGREHASIAPSTPKQPEHFSPSGTAAVLELSSSQLL